MYYGTQTESEVMKEFERIAKEQGFVKTAAEETTKDKYDVTGGTGEDEVKAAHPQGGADVAPAGDDWGKFETIVEQHNINEGIATKSPTGKLAYVIKMLQKMATAVEEDGLEHKSAGVFQISKILDEAVGEIVSLAKKKKDDEDEDEEDKDEKDKKDKDKEDEKDEKKDKKGKGKKKLPEGLRKHLEEKKKKKAGEEVAFTVK